MLESFFSSLCRALVHIGIFLVICCWLLGTHPVYRLLEQVFHALKIRFG